MLNRDCLGKIYPATAYEVTAAAIEAYARACNETNTRYFSAMATAAPPVFAAVVTWIPLLTALTDPALGADLIRLLHTRQSIEFFAPVRPGEALLSSARITSIETVNAGEQIVIELIAANQTGHSIARVEFTALIRSRRRAPVRADAPERQPEISAGALTVTETLDLDQTSRYAEASGDRNPIHLDPLAAKLAGLPGIVVHGLCTMAFASRAVVDHACGGDPRRVRRIAVEFSRPVFPGDALTTSLWRVENRPDAALWNFATVNAAGVAVLRDGSAEIIPA